MEYQERAGSAAYALPDARAGFVRRTYAHLALAVLGFLALEFVLLNLPGVREFAALMTQGWNWLLVLGAFFVMSLVADRMARSEVSRGVQVRRARLVCRHTGGHLPAAHGDRNFL